MKIAVMSSHNTNYHNNSGDICSKKCRESSRIMASWGRNAVWRGHGDWGRRQGNLPGGGAICVVIAA